MRILTALTLTFFILITAQAEGFRNAEFGMSVAEVKATENEDWYEVDEGVLAFDTKLARYDVSAGYIFVEDAFVRGAYLFNDRSSNENDYLRNFDGVDRLLTEKYGEPDEEDTEWIDDRMKNSPAHHGWALLQGDFTKRTVWKLKASKIVHGIFSRDYEIIHRIDYISLEMADAEEKEALDNL